MIHAHTPADFTRRHGAVQLGIFFCQNLVDGIHNINDTAVKRRKLAQQHRLDVAGASPSGSMG